MLWLEVLLIIIVYNEKTTCIWQVVFLHADSGTASQTFVGPATISKGLCQCHSNPLDVTCQVDIC